ncbi:MAG: peptide-methionine (S)-S-oxide reductase MsrA [Agriterribacter sp.]
MNYLKNSNAFIRYIFAFLGIIPASILLSCAQKNNVKANTMGNENDTIHTVSASDGTKEIATFGNGCFWCTEAIFQQLKGVSKVTSGYSGGHVENPTYEEVCSKTTGHAEAIQIEFDPAVITYDELLEVFWQTHDPTTLNRQGNDVGPQYRSVVFYHNETQKKKAEEYKAALDKSSAFSKPIVTSIEPFKNFYAAEDYHQNYFKLNGRAPYCQFVIKPKVEKFEKVFKSKLKSH